MENKTIFNRISAFGIGRILRNKDFIFSLAVIILIVLFLPSRYQSVDEGFVSTIINIGISLAALIIAAFSILISFSNKDFIVALKEMKLPNKVSVYDNLLFLFEWNIYVAMSTVVIGIIINYFYFNMYLYLILMFFFFYMIFSIINLVSFVTYFGQAKGEYEQLNKKP